MLPSSSTGTPEEMEDPRGLLRGDALERKRDRVEQDAGQGNHEQQIREREEHCPEGPAPGRKRTSPARITISELRIRKFSAPMSPGGAGRFLREGLAIRARAREWDRGQALSLPRQTRNPLKSGRGIRGCSWRRPTTAPRGPGGSAGTAAQGSPSGPARAGGSRPRRGRRRGAFAAHAGVEDLALGHREVPLRYCLDSGVGKPPEPKRTAMPWPGGDLGNTFP